MCNFAWEKRVVEAAPTNFTEDLNVDDSRQVAGRLEDSDCAAGLQISRAFGGLAEAAKKNSPNIKRRLNTAQKIDQTHTQRKSREDGNTFPNYEFPEPSRFSGPVTAHSSPNSSHRESLWSLLLQPPIPRSLQHHGGQLHNPKLPELPRTLQNHPNFMLRESLQGLR